MKKYLIVTEKTASGFSAYSPDLPGCVSTGHSQEEVEKNMRDAIAFHLDGLREEGQPVPEPQSYSAYVEPLPEQLEMKDNIANKNARQSPGVFSSLLLKTKN